MENAFAETVSRGNTAKERICEAGTTEITHTVKQRRRGKKSRKRSGRGRRRNRERDEESEGHENNEGL